jgi:hypothetical protein
VTVHLNVETVLVAKEWYARKHAGLLCPVVEMIEREGGLRSVFDVLAKYLLLRYIKRHHVRPTDQGHHFKKLFQ